MVVRDKPNAFQLFFIVRGSIIPLILPQIVCIALLGAIVAVTQRYFPAVFPNYSPAAFALLGVALSLFLGFRNNACYDRWWEARKQWGQLVVDGRSLARQVTSFIDDQDEGGSETKQRLVHLSIAFTHALRHNLRQSDPGSDIKKYIDPRDWPLLLQSKHPPDYILRLMGRELGSCRKKQLLSDILVQSIDQRITSMAGVLAACERIRTTPLPFAYMLLVHRTAYLYCFLLPFGLVTSLGLLTPLFCAIVAYTFFGLDALSEELEEPFGLSANDLPLSAISRTLEINLLETLGEECLLTQLEPEAGCLQ
jgi:putative membrane protein